MDDADGGLRGLRAQPGPGLRRALELTGLVARLPHQLVHGDFWDNNVGFLGGRPVLVADFDFMGERARIDDLALTLWYARCDLGVATAPAVDERSQARQAIAA
jgi:Ser/Thr protein kinase RdoA (MazF antagonist)